MALLVREKPLVLVGLAGTAVVVVTGRFSVGGLVVGGEPGFTVVADTGANEVGGKAVGGASGFEDFGSVDEGFAAVVVVGSLGAAVVVVVVGDVVWAAVVVGLAGAVRETGAGRPEAVDLGAFRGALMVAAEADATAIPAVIVARATIAVIHRAAVGEVRCWVMPATYELDLKPHWESENSFRQHPQRSLRLGS
jgi:hypothetical protein